MPIDVNQLDALFAAAVQKASAAGASLDDINKAAEMAKSASEARKAAADAANSGAQMRLEGWKSFATFLVPVVSFLTIAFTVWIQYLQLQETRRQDEATQWRGFLSDAKPSSNAVQSDPTFGPRLQSFFSSPTYRNQAISISKRLMGGIADVAGFKDIFAVTFGDLDSKNFSDVVDVGKLLYSNMSKSYSNCKGFADGLSDAIRHKLPPVTDAAGICSRVIPEKAIKDLGLAAEPTKTLAQLRHDTAAFEDEIAFFSQQMGDFLRHNYAVGLPISRTTLPLSGLYLMDVDLSNVDFSSFDISDSVFDSCVLKGSKLTPKKFGRVMDIRFSEWWEASAVDQGALADLIQTEYPYYVKDETYPSNMPVDKAHYVQRIMALCVPAKPFCQADKLLFAQ